MGCYLEPMDHGSKTPAQQPMPPLQLSLWHGRTGALQSLPGHSQATQGQAQPRPRQVRWHACLDTFLALDYHKGRAGRGGAGHIRSLHGFQQAQAHGAKQPAGRRAQVLSTGAGDQRGSQGPRTSIENTTPQMDFGQPGNATCPCRLPEPSESQTARPTPQQYGQAGSTKAFLTLVTRSSFS